MALGIIYFTQDSTGPDSQVIVLRFMLIYLAIMTLTTLPIAYFTFLSRFMDQSSRTIYLFTRTSGMLVTGLLLAILLSTFDITGDKFTTVVGKIDIGVSIQLAILLTIVFIAMYILPYLIGASSFSKEHSSRLEERKSIVEGIYNVLRRPESSAYNDRLENERQNLEDILRIKSEEFSIHSLIEYAERNETGIDSNTPQIFTRALVGARGPLFAHTFERMRQLYNESSSMDPVLQHELWIREQVSMIDTIVSDLDRRPDDVSKENAARSWADSLREDINQIEKELEQQAKRRPVTLAIVFVATPILSAVLGELGKSLMKIFFADLSQ